MELRTEIRSHMRAMGCHAVIGYSEQTFIRDELIVLSAIGTAALVSLGSIGGGGRAGGAAAGAAGAGRYYLH